MKFVLVSKEGRTRRRNNACGGFGRENRLWFGNLTALKFEGMHVHEKNNTCAAYFDLGNRVSRIVWTGDEVPPVKLLHDAARRRDIVGKKRRAGLDFRPSHDRSPHQ